MKFCGIVGFWDENEVEAKPGVWKGSIVERPYKGDIYRNTRRFQTENNQQNDGFNVNNQISILSDLYARQNWDSIRYVIWNGKKWKVTSVDVNYPRLVLEIGGLYHGEDEIRTS